VDLPVPGIDQHGQVIDVLLSQRRDLAATRRFFIRVLLSGTVLAEVTTDRSAAARLTLWRTLGCHS
jgi:transposase, IS6 family